jgi:hypothetical protein
VAAVTGEVNSSRGPEGAVELAILQNFEVVFTPVFLEPYRRERNFRHEKEGFLTGQIATRALALLAGRRPLRLATNRLRWRGNWDGALAPICEFAKGLSQVDPFSPDPVSP